MKNIVLLFLFLIPVFLFAQYPTTGNKQRLGWQTTGDGLIWRGVAADTVNKPNNRNYPYFQLDTVNAVLYRFIQTKQQWQPVTGGTDIDSLIYATRYWVSTNFFPLEGGTLTGTGGAGFVGFPSQVTAPGTPASGLNVYAQGSSFNWKGTDGYERLFASTLTGGRTYTLPDVSGTFALGTGTADRSAIWSATNTLATGNFTDNGTKVQALLPFQFQTYTTAGLPTGVTGYHVYNTTTNGPAWYQGSRWAYGLESTFNRGTATYVPFFDANGQVTESQRVVYNGTQFVVKGTTNYASTNTKSFRVLSNDGVEMFFVDDNGTFGNAALSVSLGAGAYQFGTSGFPALRFPGAYNILQHQTTTSFNIGGGATNIRIGDYNSWQSTRTLRVNTKFEINGSTTANRPSATAAMSVLYHNTDSTFLEYNPNNTGWVGIASRPYVRSLIPTTFYSGDGSLSGNRTIMANNYNVLFDNITEFNLLSGGVTPGSTVLSDVYYAQTQYYNLAKTRYLKRYETVDTRPITSSASPNFTEIIEWDFGGGVGFEWLGSTQLDTTNGVFTLKTGPRYNPGIHISNSLRPSSGSAYLSSPRWSFLGTNSTENETANSYHTLWGASATDMLMGLKDGGKFLIASDSTFIFDPSIDMPQLNKAGAGNKEASDLSKTESSYAAWFATDGTIIEKPLSSFADGNGIYTGSGTLASHTTRAAIPETGNLLFTQKYNSNADSAYIQVINGLDGNREVRIGLTDTMSTGSATLVLRQDADNEVMAWDLRSSDGSGATRLTGDGGNISATVDEGFEFQVSGMVRAKREAYHEITSTSSPQTLSSTYSDNLINQGGTQATFTLNMPASPEDGQVCYITFNNAISTLTIDGNGETIVGSAVTTGVPGSQRKFKFYTGIGWIKQY